ncbi:MAG: membrane integrity-associated transporter subunit PqiC [Deltaproteobacteria bacterium]|nr:MAG: membrane integrity-associated transporter subunit PqiC [Deltaproteobacteria bacterium]
MPNRRLARPVHRRLLAAALLAALGCASGPAPRDHFYRLQVAPPSRAPAEPTLHGTLEISRFRADALTGERQLIFLESSDASEVRRHAYHRWVDPPSVMLQIQLAGYLRAAHAAELVILPEVRVRPDFLLAGRILRLEQILSEAASRVVVELELSMTRMAGGDVMVLRRYRESRALDSRDVAESVRAYGEATSAIFERFLAEVRAMAKRPSE